MDRLNPLNDYIFLKVMGEKGDEEQLLAFINAVLQRTGKQKLLSIEIVENKSIPADIISGKSCVLDVRAVLENGDKADIEVQLRNLGNMDRRSLFYWSREFTKGLASGQEYQEVPNVIAINIVGYEFLPQVPDFHTIFHIWEDTHRDIMLTDALEIHFLDMVKFGSVSNRDLEHDNLHRWLTYFDKRSSPGLIEEVIKMDVAIRKAEERLQAVTRNEEDLWFYEIREKALSDWTSGVNHARREGIKEGMEKGIEKERENVARNALMKGYSIEQVIDITGLDEETIKSLNL